MSYYTVAAIDVVDPGWVAGYVARVTPLVERMGAAEVFYDSAAYRPFGDSRRAGARTDLLLAAGEDVTGKATIEGASA